MFPRYVPDERLLDVYDFFIRRQELLPEATRLQTLMRARYELACAEIGEPPLRDQMNDIPLWVDQRMGEQSERRGAHRSDVSIIFYNQELWGLSTRDELAAGMRALLSGVQKDRRE